MTDAWGMPSTGSGRDGDRLWTAGVFMAEPDDMGVMFLAVLAVTRAEAIERLSALGGVEVPDDRVEAGFDASGPYAELLVSGTLAEEMAKVMAEPSADRNAGYAVRLERRFRG